MWTADLNLLNLLNLSLAAIYVNFSDLINQLCLTGVYSIYIYIFVSLLLRISYFREDVFQGRFLFKNI